MTTEARVRVVIVDDEPLARDTLRLLMRDDAGVEIVGECATGRDAVDVIRRVAPDLVFLDIQMPELDGFQTLARLGIGSSARFSRDALASASSGRPTAASAVSAVSGVSVSAGASGSRRFVEGPASSAPSGSFAPASEIAPVIIFVTAYDRYALKAFEAHALDYLVKPFTDERFYETLARAKAHVRQRAFGALGERVLSMLRAQGLAVPAPDAAAAPPTVTTTSVGMTTPVGTTMVGPTPAVGTTTSVGMTTHVGTAETSAATAPGDRALPAAAGADTTHPASVAEARRRADTADADMPNLETVAGGASTAGTQIGDQPQGGAPEPPIAAAAPARPLDRIAVKANGRVTLLRTADIDWIEACDDYVRLHTGETTHELRLPLKALAARLDARRFVRIHRSAIVNLDRVRELQPHFHGSYLVILKSGASLPLSRARRDALREALGGLLP